MQPSPAPSPLNIVLLEDDEGLRERVLAPELRTYGFVVHTAGHPAELDAIFGHHPVDVLVLDVGLPDEDGFSIVRRMRGTEALGLVLLTAREENDDRIRGLNDGADAYLSKPVSIPVLAATLRSVARRLTVSPTLVTSSDWALADGGWLLRSPKGADIALTEQERTVVGALMSHRGQPVERETLIGLLTDDAHEFDPHRLEMTVHRLRTKVMRASAETLPLRAVRARGYIMLQPGGG
ncbi:MAG: response regulator transcription factor [Luteibacter sp.]